MLMELYRCPSCNGLHGYDADMLDEEVSELATILNDRFTTDYAIVHKNQVRLILMDKPDFWEGKTDETYIEEWLIDENLPFTFKETSTKNGYLVLVFEPKKEEK